jgi:hypothetical protein
LPIRGWVNRSHNSMMDLSHHLNERLVTSLAPSAQLTSDLLKLNSPTCLFDPIAPAPTASFPLKLPVSNEFSISI